MATKARSLILLAAAGAFAGSAIAQPVPEGGRKFSTALTGAAECNAAGTCNLGDPDGSGTADITINVGQQRVCWDITVNNISAPTRGHIHRAPAGLAGPIVVGFFEINDVDLERCTSTTQPVDRALLLDILRNPQNYYVNVHTADFPAGAIRGQLSK